MKTKSLVIKIVIMIIIIFLIVIGISINQKGVKKDKSTAVVMVGFPKDGATVFQKELTEAFNYKSYLDKGHELAKQGKIKDAIKEYETAFSLAKMRGARGVVLFAMADAYEKSRDYEKALKQISIICDNYINDWAKESVVERAIYLDYVLKGEYDLAIEHAQKALEADAKLPNRPVGGREDYIDRLNDLKAAKDYILSLKNKK